MELRRRVEGCSSVCSIPFSVRILFFHGHFSILVYLAPNIGFPRRRYWFGVVGRTGAAEFSMDCNERS